MKRPTLKDMRIGRERMRQRCEKASEAILKEAGVKSIEYHDRGLRGHAYPKSGFVSIPRPTTRRRLAIIAHEAGHVALQHDKKKATHREEYEAEQYALKALQRQGIPVPKKALQRGKEYVAWKIHQAVVRGAKKIDRDALRWCKDYVSEKVKTWMVRNTNHKM